jgi:lysyl-tRNA synthetase class 2
MSVHNEAEAPKEEINEILAQRLAKLDAMREKGQAFPNDFRRENISDDLHNLYDDKSKEELD